jgi:hypothetical protein
MARSRRLKKYDVVVTKDKDVADESQVPASGITVTTYRRGCAVSSGSTVSDGATNQSLAVFDVGEIKDGDTLQLASDVIAGNSTPSVTVDNITGPTSVQVDSDSNGDFTVVADDRLVITNNTPAAYDEPSGTSSLGSITTDAYGYARAYLECEGQAIDVKLSGSGIDATMRYDEFLGGAESHVTYADDFATLQDAIDATPERGTLQLSSRQYEPSATLEITRSIRIRGEGRGENEFADDTQVGTTIKQFSANTEVIKCVTDGAGGIIIEDLRIQGPASSGTGDGIRFEASATPISYIVFRNLEITGCGNHGLYLKHCNFPLITNCLIQGNYGDGVRLFGTSPSPLLAQARIFHTYLNDNQDFGLYCNNTVGLQVDGIGIEDNQQEQSGKSDDGWPMMYLQTCHEVSIQRIDFEDWQQTTTKTAIEMANCLGVHISANAFVNPATETDTIGIKVMSGCEGLFIGPNRFTEVNGTCIWIKDNTTDGEIVVKNALIMDQGYQGSVGTTIDLPPVADRENKNIVVLDESIGMMLPVIPTASLPAAAAGNEGCIVYDSTANTFIGSDGTDWVSNWA